MCEKYNGIRAYWDGEDFYSRLGNHLEAPEWFIRDLPNDVELDGELWGGRQKLQYILNVVGGGCVFDASD